MFFHDFFFSWSKILYYMNCRCIRLQGRVHALFEDLAPGTKSSPHCATPLFIAIIEYYSRLDWTNNIPYHVTPGMHGPLCSFIYIQEHCSDPSEMHPWHGSQSGASQRSCYYWTLILRLPRIDVVVPFSADETKWCIKLPSTLHVDGSTVQVLPLLLFVDLMIQMHACKLLRTS